MGNHDVWDTPENSEQEARDREFQERAKAIHERLKGRNPSLFTVAELERLMNMPTRANRYAVSRYSQDDMDWLQELEIKALV